MNVNPITDHLCHALLIITGSSDQSWFSVCQWLHGIIKMCHMVCTSSHGLRCCIVISCCMTKGNAHLIMYLINEFHSTIHIRCQSYQLHHISGIFIQFTEKSGIWFADIALHMSAFFLRIQKWAFHIDSPDSSSVFHFSHSLNSSKNFLQFFCRQCHGSRTIGSNSVTLFVFQNNLKSFRISIRKIMSKCTVTVNIHQPRKHPEPSRVYNRLVRNLIL